MARYRKNSAEIIYTDKWRGLDMSREEKKNFSSSVYMKNFAVTEKYDLKKRCGYKKLISGLDCDSCFYAGCAGGVEDQTVEGFEKVKHPKFEVFEDKGGKFRFRLKARNGEIILASQGYKTKDTCLNGIESVKKNAPESPVVKEEE